MANSFLLPHQSGRRPWLQGATRCLTVAAVSTVGVGAEANAQTRSEPLPPVRVIEGPPLADALIADLQRRVRSAAERNRRYVEIRQVVAGDSGAVQRGWRKAQCEIRDVAIEIQSSEIAEAPVVAFVGGRATSRVTDELSTREAAARQVPALIASDVRFAFLYIRVNGEWRLTLAQLKPTQLPEAEWQDLRLEPPGSDQQHACVVTRIWREI